MNCVIKRLTGVVNSEITLKEKIEGNPLPKIWESHNLPFLYKKNN